MTTPPVPPELMHLTELKLDQYPRLSPGTSVLRVRGVIKELYEYQSGSGTRGPWSLQNGTLEDPETGATVAFMLKDRELKDYLDVTRHRFGYLDLMATKPQDLLWKRQKDPAHGTKIEVRPSARQLALLDKATLQQQQVRPSSSVPLPPSELFSMRPSAQETAAEPAMPPTPIPFPRPAVEPAAEQLARYGRLVRLVAPEVNRLWQASAEDLSMFAVRDGAVYGALLHTFCELAHRDGLHLQPAVNPPTVKDRFLRLVHGHESHAELVLRTLDQLSDDRSLGDLSEAEMERLTSDAAFLKALGRITKTAVAS